MYDPVILSKLALALTGVAASVVLCRAAFVERMSRAGFTAFATGLALAVRIGFFVLIYVVQGQPVPTDVPLHYCPEARHVLEGLMPGRDFASSYAPLFDYAGAALLTAWNDPRAFVVTAMVLELLSVPLWIAVARRWFPESTVRRATLLYLTNVKLLLSVSTGQNQVWVAALFALALWLQARGFSLAAGLTLGLSVCLVKVLALIFAPVMWLADRRRTVFTFGCLALPVAVYTGFFLAGADPLQPLRIEGRLYTSGNLPFLLTITGADPEGGTGRAGLAALLALWAYGFVRLAGPRTETSPARSLRFASLLLMSLLLFSKKAYTHYLAMGTFCVCLTAAEAPFATRDLLIYALFNLVAALEPALWARWLPFQDLRLFHAPLAAGHPGFGKLVAFTLVELALLGCYVHYAARALTGPRREAVV